MAHTNTYSESFMPNMCASAQRTLRSALSVLSVAEKARHLRQGELLMEDEKPNTWKTGVAS